MVSYGTERDDPMKHSRILIGILAMLAGCGDTYTAPVAPNANVITITTPGGMSMSGTVVAEETLHVGSELVVEGPSPLTSFVTIFEDDGETAYFYALDTASEDNPIVDALHIYNATSVTDRDKPSTVHILWSSDGLKAALLINQYPHAVFDFEAKRGYCRSGFPAPDERWTRYSHDWDDSSLELFK